ncbi:MAG TPA: dihydrofolate reductase family protein [Candidatus Acidoferrales bacterium]|nr:dihydrofolate reductase family protein [Candidatus Acidoferrales bacterium]
MRKLIEITFMSLNGVMDAPDIVQEAQRYFLSSEEHNDYQKERLFAADALLLGRKTYEVLSKAYPSMAKSGGGVPMDFVDRMNSIPKYVASMSLKEASWNAKVIRGDIAEEMREIKDLPGKDIIKYGTGPLDSILFGQHLVDLLCIIVYPFVLGHGRHLFEGLEFTTHLRLSEVKRFESGTVVLEYIP